MSDVAAFHQLYSGFSRWLYPSHALYDTWYLVYTYQVVPDMLRVSYHTGRYNTSYIPLRLSFRAPRARVPCAVR